MSIVTKTGDGGTTGLMYNRRVPKTDARIEACGTVDELNSALGIARASIQEDAIRGHLLSTQKELVGLMGELATMAGDLERYRADGYAILTAGMTARLDGAVKEIEAKKISYSGWATPGATAASAALDLARSICRRAERRVCELRERGETLNPEILVYLNRLSDLLWLFARWTEREQSS